MLDGASLLLLPADVNRSLQDKPYEYKREPYSKQNFYAASLNDRVYVHQPQFRQFIDTTALPFKPLPHFTKAEQQARRDLLKTLVKKMWSPARLESI